MNPHKLLKIFINKLKNKITRFVSLKLGKNYTKPENIYFLMTNKCNFQCAMCPQWQQGQKEDIQDYLDLKQIRKIITQAADWGIKNFGVSGGEPLLFKDKLMAILEFANQKGLHTHFVTNGWLLDKNVIKQYNEIGGGHISLSIDAASDKHDQLRGKQGAFDHVRQALNAFKEVKPENILLKINLVISDQNLDEVLDVVNLSQANNASIFIQPYDPYNWHNRKTLSWQEYHQNYPMWVSQQKFAKLEQVIKQLLKIKKKYPSLILNSDQHLDAILGYYSLKTGKEKCLIGYQNMVINPDGKISVCKFGTVGDLNKQSLQQIWQSEQYEKVRQAALNCDFNCMLGCMYDPGILDWLKSGLDYIIKK